MSNLVRSEFNPLALLGIALLLCMSVGMLIWIGLRVVDLSQVNAAAGKSIFSWLVPGLALTALFSILFYKAIINLKIIEVDDHSITYRYLFFPFQTFVFEKTELDGQTFVLEKRNGVVGSSGYYTPISFSPKEAVWIFRNRKLTLRVSSIVYRNYDELKSALSNVRHLDVEISDSFSQALHIFGLTKLEKINSTKG